MAWNILRFESKEELKKIYTDSTYSFGFNDGIVEGIDKTWESFTERVEFYKKYKDKKWNFLTDFKCHGDKESDWRFTKYDEFNDWLLDYCFGDIVEEEI